MRLALTLALALCAAPVWAQSSETDCDRLAGYVHTPRQPGFAGAPFIADPVAAIAACEAATRAAGADPFLAFLLARAYQAADPQDPRLVNLIAQGAAASASFAASRLGILHAEGMGGLVADAARAQELAREGCAAFPDPRALAGCNNLAADLDGPEALDLFARNCDAGFGLSCSNLADRMRDMPPPADDPVRQVALNDRACALGDPFGCAAAGYARETGNGIATDLPGAFALYARACDEGEGYGCLAQGLMLAEGTGVAAADWAQAQQVLARGCTLGSDDACHERALGLMYGEDHVGVDGTPEDQAEAAAEFERLCAANHGLACADMGYLTRQGAFFAQDTHRALGFHLRSCALGAGAGCNNLGVHYARGEGVGADLQNAARYYAQGCDLGSVLGCLNLADLLESGDLGRADPAGAQLRLTQACAMGLHEACDRVTP